MHFRLFGILFRSFRYFKKFLTLSCRSLYRKVFVILQLAIAPSHDVSENHVIDMVVQRTSNADRPPEPPPRPNTDAETAVSGHTSTASKTTAVNNGKSAQADLDIFNIIVVKSVKNKSKFEKVFLWKKLKIFVDVM